MYEVQGISGMGVHERIVNKNQELIACGGVLEYRRIIYHTCNIEIVRNIVWSCGGQCTLCTRMTGVADRVPDREAELHRERKGAVG